MVCREGYKEERVHLGCPQGELRRHRRTGEDVRIGDKRSLYIQSDGSFKSVGKVCLDCRKVWMDGELLGKAGSMSSKEKKSLGDKLRSIISPILRRMGI